MRIILVCTDNIVCVTIAYINHQAGLRSCSMSPLVRHLLLRSLCVS